MAKKNKKAKASVPSSEAVTIPPNDLEAGIMWLTGLGEPRFRDSVLMDLFKRMREAGEIEWFENIHGRNDKGVDYLIVNKTTLGRNTIGIQVKGKEITRTGGNGTLSAVEIVAECEAAMKHEFVVQNANRRLDTITLWTCAHITSDAEAEFNTPGLAYRIQITKARDVFSLIERFAPGQLENVPQLALVRYITEQSNPKAEGVRVFGCPMNPKVHFLELEFSNFSPESMESMKTESGYLRRKKSTVTLETLLDDTRHTVLFAEELTGKTYLLKRCLTLFGQRRRLAILLNPTELSEIPASPQRLLADTIRCLTTTQAASLAQNGGVVFLVDDVHKLSQKVREWLFGLDARQFRVIAASRAVLVPQHVVPIYITGARLGHLPHFLRSLNVPHSKELPDRAQSYIERTLFASRLPKNAFTISIMLQECQHAGSRFSTPTMGRLIERFVELQLGSHSDQSFAVDFETKRNFISRLAGQVESEMSLSQFRRKLGKFIEISKHPQSVEDFISDFQKSGIFVFDGDTVQWAHHTFKQYFWVRNLVTNRQYDPIIKALCSGSNSTLAALAGSQIHDTKALFEPLIEEVAKTPIPSLQSLVPEGEFGIGLADIVTDADEEQLLTDVERSHELLSNKGSHPVAKLARASFFGDREVEDEEIAGSAEEPPKLSEDTKALIRKRFTLWVDDVLNCRLELAFNLASLLVNARGAKIELKQRALSALLRKSNDFGMILQKLLTVIYPDNTRLLFNTGWVSMYSELHITDRMLGDPFLLNVLRGMKKVAKTNVDRLKVLDLLLCCGDDVNDEIVSTLRAINRLDVTFALYLRIVGLYYFRFHRTPDRDSLRKLLKDIRIAAQSKVLPKV